MSDLRTAAQQTLEAIDWLRLHLRRDHQCLHMDPAQSGIPAWINKSETNLRAALAEPVQAWHFVDCEGECLACLIEREVKAAFGNQGLTYLLRHVGGQDE